MRTSNPSPAGRTVVRYLAALAFGKGIPANAVAFASGRGSWDDRDAVVDALRELDDPTHAQRRSHLHMLERAATSPLDTSTPIANVANAVALDLVALLQPVTIFGKLAMRRTPIGVRIVAQTGAVQADFIDQGAPTPVAELSWADGYTLRASKVGIIMAASMELLRLATPDAEETLRADLRDALALGLDSAFLHPDRGAVGDTPASIAFGAPSIAATGGTVADIDAALQAAGDAMTAAGGNVGAAVWLLSPTTALHLSLKRSNGALAYPLLTPTGGFLAGRPVLITEAADLNNSPAERVVVLADASAIAFADGGAEITLSTRASVQMNTTPSAGAQQMVSLWQANLAAIRAIRLVSWHLRRPGGVVVIRGAQGW